MAPATGPVTPGLASFLRSIPSEPDETLIELLISLLRRRQIRDSRPCAVATAYLLRRIVVRARPKPGKSISSAQLLERVQEVGKRLVAAQPRELVVGNLVRRVVGLIREEQENELADRDVGGDSSSRGGSENEFETPQPSETGRPDPRSVPVTPRSSLLMQARHAAPTRAATEPRKPQLSQSASMFSLLSHPNMGSARGSPMSGTPSGSATPSIQHSDCNDIRQEIIEGIGEIIDELEQCDEQIASYALEQIHTNEVILTYSFSPTVQRFLLKAAARRHFTVIHAECHPNNHHKVHNLVTGHQQHDADNLPGASSFHKTLTASGTTVILIPDSATFAVMSRVNKVILSPHAILSNGALVAASGTKLIAKAAMAHRVPVIVLSGTYQLCPTPFPHDPDPYLEYGDPGRVLPYQERDLVDDENVEVENPLWDFVGPDCVDMYVTNLGGHAPSYLYRVIRDQYRDEEVDL